MVWHGQLVAVVIPAYNEALLIGRTVAELPGWVDHIVVVDDASLDHTSQQAIATGRAGLRVLRHGRNRGVGAATVTGYRQALVLGAELVVGINGDAQMNPDDIPHLLQALDQGADLARGNRFARPKSLQQMPLERRIGNRLLSAMTRLAIGADHLGDSQCGFHALTRSALERLDLDLLWPRYGFPNDLLARSVEAGLRVTEVGVDTIYGAEISGMRPWHVVHPVGTLICAAALRHLSAPLRAVARSYR